MWAFILFFINQHYNSNLTFNIKDAVVTILCLVFFSYALTASLRYYRPSTKDWYYLIIWIMSFTFVWHYVNMFIIKWVADGQLNYLNQSAPLKFVFGALMFSCFVLIGLLWNYLNDKQEEINRKIKLEQIAREAELNNLRQQLQPHFLFNSLNSINALTLSNPEQAREMISKLSDFLRGTLKKEQAKLISLQEELAHIALYLDIEKVRFGYRLNTIVDVSADVVNCTLPPLILQPAIENAIKFGLYDTIDPITIQVKCYKEDNNLKIDVINPFDPLTSIKPHGTGFGLKAIARRLSLIFNRSDLLQISKSENIFKTSLIIPQLHD